MKSAYKLILINSKMAREIDSFIKIAWEVYNYDDGTNPNKLKEVPPTGNRLSRYNETLEEMLERDEKFLSRQNKETNNNKETNSNKETLISNKMKDSNFNINMPLLAGASSAITGIGTALYFYKKRKDKNEMNKIYKNKDITDIFSSNKCDEKQINFPRRQTIVPGH